MRFRLFTASMIVALAFPIQLAAYGLESEDRLNSGFIVFDAPNSGVPACAPSGCGTYGYAINRERTVVGYYLDPDIVAHGFLLSPDGRFTVIDAPGQTLTNGQGEGIYATSINDQGEVAGQFVDASLISHGFIRYPDGRLSLVDVKGAGTGTGQGTVGAGINSEGDVVGTYIDSENVYHGFMRSCDGVITTFDAPDAGTGAGQGTFTYEKSINAAGEISGFTTDASNVNHGFVRLRNGSFVTYDAPGAGTGPGQGTTVGGINAEGAVTGYYVDSTNEIFAFVRYRNGSFTTFSVPGGVATASFSINQDYSVTGIYIDSNSGLHGFVGAPNGPYITLNAPGASNTRPEFVSPFGVVVGFFYDASGVVHGFVWIP